jgi:S1-C subfamily serine protease
LIQIAGMINNGNSGGPLIDVVSRAVVGMVTAKYVPLLMEIEQLARGLKEIPQFPSSVGLGDIDFAKFVNLTVQSMWQLAAVLRLVQVGTGWAVPARYFPRKGA